MFLNEFYKKEILAVNVEVLLKNYAYKEKKKRVRDFNTLSLNADSQK